MGIEYRDAVFHEKDILNSKASLIKLNQRLKIYSEYIKKEYRYKSKVRSLSRSLSVVLDMIKRDLPEIPRANHIEEDVEEQEPIETMVSSIETETPETTEVEEQEPEKAETFETTGPSSLEQELMEIQKKLSGLS